MWLTIIKGYFLLYFATGACKNEDIELCVKELNIPSDGKVTYSMFHRLVKYIDAITAKAEKNKHKMNTERLAEKNYQATDSTTSNDKKAIKSSNGQSSTHKSLQHNRLPKAPIGSPSRSSPASHKSEKTTRSRESKQKKN